MQAVILAGGQSSRMGRDKSFVSLGSASMIEKIIEVLRSSFAEQIMIISNKPEEYKHLGFPVYKDIIENAGPLGGIYAALNYSAFCENLIVACDMPMITKQLINILTSSVDGHDAAVPVMDGYFEPFPAVYKKTCLSGITRCLEAGNNRVTCFYDSIQINPIYLDACLTGKEFTNINTPKQLCRLIEEKGAV